MVRTFFSKIATLAVCFFLSVSAFGQVTTSFTTGTGWTFSPAGSTTTRLPQAPKGSGPAAAAIIILDSFVAFIVHCHQTCPGPGPTSSEINEAIHSILNQQNIDSNSAWDAYVLSQNLHGTHDLVQSQKSYNFEGTGYRVQTFQLEGSVTQEELHDFIDSVYMLKSVTRSPGFANVWINIESNCNGMPGSKSGFSALEDFIKKCTGEYEPKTDNEEFVLNKIKDLGNQMIRGSKSVAERNRALALRAKFISFLKNPSLYM